MHYTQLFYQGPEDFAARTDPRKREAFWGAFFPYMKALKEAGVVVAGAGLEPPGLATTLRREGEYLISSRRQWEGQLQPKLSERPEN